MPSFVIDKGKSDHAPFIQDFRFADDTGSFRALTYNVNHGSDADDVRELFNEFAFLRVGVMLLQEVKVRRRGRNTGIRPLLRALGYSSKYASPEFCIAWNGEWEYVWSDKRQMSPTEYWTTNYALIVVLRHRATGKLIKFMSYHPPAHVQVPKHKAFAKVSKVLRDVARKWKRIASRNPKKIYACCFAGDDNVDEFRGWAPKDEWEFMLNGPLEQIQAPEPTRGKRRIDDFRITRRLKTC